MSDSGPLSDVRILEVGGIGPAPFAGMHLAQLGADVVRVERPEPEQVLPGDRLADPLLRGKRLVSLDLKTEVDILLTLVERADVLLEGFRPGTAERLGFGPEVVAELVPALVYGRVTGWGQDGPLASRVGHDANYIGLTGALHAIGPPDSPALPINFVGDFGGGSLYLVVGVLAALLEARATGRGRVVDAAMVDGAAHLMASVHQLANAGAWRDERQANLLDGGAPFYAIYRAADGGFLAVGAIERRFWTELLRVLDVDVDPSMQDDEATWPATRAALAAAFSAQPRDHWSAVFADVDACVTPVLGVHEAADHPHVIARGTVTRDADGSLHAAPAPRFIPATDNSSAHERPRRMTVAAVLDSWHASEALHRER